MVKTAFASILDRGEVDKENLKGRSYDKVLYRFSLGAESDIALVGLTFLGLPKNAKQNSQAVQIYVEVAESSVFKDVGVPLATILSGNWYPVIMRKEETVVVELPYPVRIKKGNWCDIGFQIEGPPTQTLLEKTKWVHTHLSNDGFVRIHTTCSRSPKQLKEVKFFPL